MQIDFNYYANSDLLIAFSCDRHISHRFFHYHSACHETTTLSRDNRGSKLTIGRGGMLKVQHLVSVAKPSIPHPHIDSAGYQQHSRIAYIEFFVKPEVEEDTENDA
ncbi:hypothetical protein Pfo_025828 [Paulownia fortunei]|nr:hypothetical protein Pfo_025828 [Paulownia fortunei]